MNQQDVIAKVKAVMEQGFEIPPDRILPTSRIKEDLELDSLDAVDMLVYIEDELNIRVDIEKFRDTKTMQDIYDVVFALAKDKGVNQ